MLKPIFIHCQTFSHKANPAGQNIRQVILEALRQEGFDQHVEDPKPPKLIVGNPFDFLAIHVDHVAQRSTSVSRKGKIFSRPIRQDRHTLFTIVASYPIPLSTVHASKAELDRLQKWTELTLDWVTKCYGKQLKVAFAHIDETYPHLHFWLLPDNPDADARQLHPGKASKIEVETRLKGEGVAPREAVKAGNASLKSAMRGWIDDYHLNVGAPLGFSRDGPKRRRLSRAQVVAEAAMLKHHQALEARRIELEEQLISLEEVKTAALIDIRKQHTRLEEMADEYLKKVSGLTQRIEHRAIQLKAAEPMLDAVAREIAAGTISFNPDTGWAMKDPTPFRSAAPVWRALSPAVKKLLEMMKSAEDGQFQDAVRQMGPEFQKVPEIPRPVSQCASSTAAASMKPQQDEMLDEIGSFGM